MFKVKNKLILLVSSVVLISTVMAGCGSSDSKSASEGDKPSPQVKKITVFNNKVEITEPLEELAAEYKKETGIEVEVWGSTGDSYSQTLQTKLISNQGPTIFGVKVTDATKFRSYLYDLSNEEYVKNIAPNMALKVDGKVVGVPYGVEGYGLIYNKNLVKPEDLKDYDSFAKTLEKFKAEGINGFSLSQEAYFLIGQILNTPFALQEDPLAFIEKLNKGEVKMAETKEFQEFAKFMDAIKANAKNPMDVKYDDQIGDFATGKTAIIHQGNWAYGMFKDYGDLGFDMAMAPFPLAGNDKIAVGVGSNWAINADAPAEEIKAGNDFLNWMFTSETGMRYIGEKFGFIPAMTNIEVKNLDPLSEKVHEASNSGQTLQWAYNYFPPGIIVNDLMPATQEYFLTDMTGEQLLQKLDAAWAKSAK